jgi:hypothetical protein
MPSDLGDQRRSNREPDRSILRCHARPLGLGMSGRSAPGSERRAASSAGAYRTARASGRPNLATAERMEVLSSARHRFQTEASRAPIASHARPGSARQSWPRQQMLAGPATGQAAQRSGSANNRRHRHSMLTLDRLSARTYPPANVARSLGHCGGDQLPSGEY